MGGRKCPRFRGMELQYSLILLLVTFFIVEASDPSLLLDDSDPIGNNLELKDEELSCEYAYHKCMYRDGCKNTLGYYVMACQDVQGGQTKECSVSCRRALIGLTSTEEGKLFLKCQCQDKRCEDLKGRISVCRPAVESALRNPAGLTCLDAEMVCNADSPCANALAYYGKKCRKMFDGVKCNSNCLNSIRILRRQEKAAPLSSCRCDGTETYDCEGIQENMKRLCFGEKQVPATGTSATDSDHDEEEEDNNVDGDADYYGSGTKKVQFPYAVGSAGLSSSYSSRCWGVGVIVAAVVLAARTWV